MVCEGSSGLGIGRWNKSERACVFLCLFPTKAQTLIPTFRSTLFLFLSFSLSLFFPFPALHNRFSPSFFSSLFSLFYRQLILSFPCSIGFSVDLTLVFFLFSLPFLFFFLRSCSFLSFPAWCCRTLFALILFISFPPARFRKGLSFFLSPNSFE